MKEIYVVLGMARGGTSAITRALAAVGVDLGEKSTSGQLWGSAGFSEDSDIVYKINKRLFAQLGEVWMSAQLIDAQKQAGAKLQAIENEAINFLQERMSNREQWVFKDPRTTKLLTFWQRVFAKTNLNDNYIIALRNPLSCGRSYSHLSGNHLESSLLFWMVHMIAAVENTHHKRRVIVSYDAILQEPETQLSRLAEQLGLQAHTNEIAIYANEFLDRRLLRYTGSEEELQTNAAMQAVPLCAKLYNLLLRAARDETAIDSSEFAIEWQALMHEFKQHEAIYCYINTILMRTKVLNKKLHKIRKSIPWRLILPLWLIGSFVRPFWHRSREREVRM